MRCWTWKGRQSLVPRDEDAPAPELSELSELLSSLSSSESDIESESLKKGG